MKRLLALVPLISVIMLAGCVGPSQHVCSDGSVVQSPDECLTTTETTITCSDGSQVSEVNLCPPLELGLQAVIKTGSNAKLLTHDDTMAKVELDKGIPSDDVRAWFGDFVYSGVILEIDTDADYCNIKEYYDGTFHARYEKNTDFTLHLQYGELFKPSVAQYEIECVRTNQYNGLKTKAEATYTLYLTYQNEI